jgi:hypothetical protein
MKTSKMISASWHLLPDDHQILRGYWCPGKRYKGKNDNLERTSGMDHIQTPKSEAEAIQMEAGDEAQELEDL